MYPRMELVLYSSSAIVSVEYVLNPLKFKAKLYNFSHVFGDKLVIVIIQQYSSNTAIPIVLSVLIIHIHIQSFFHFRDSVRIFLSSRPKYAIRGTGILGQIASFEHRLRRAAPTPLALPCPFRTSTGTRTDAERDKRELAKMPHVEKDLPRFWLYLNVCSAWMIYKDWHHLQTVDAYENTWKCGDLKLYFSPSAGG